jgi:hypothetical protein
VSVSANETQPGEGNNEYADAAKSEQDGIFLEEESIYNAG